MLGVAICKVLTLSTLTWISAIMGADHDPGPLNPQPGWPAGFHAAANQPHRVHGFWVNTTDVFFYKASNEKLNAMIEALANIKQAKTKVVLHAGAGEAKSPWGSGPADSKTNWSITLYSKDGFGKQDRIMFDVWLGDGIELAKLKIPQTVEVTNGGEIEKFIKNRSGNSIEK